MLKQQPDGIESDPRKWLTLIHGEPGIGKTSFGAQIPGHYFTRAELGTKGLQTFGEPVSTWEEFVKICEALDAGVKDGWKDQREVKCLVIDTVEMLWAMCGVHVARTQQFMVKGTPTAFSDIKNVPFGLGYEATTTRLLKTLKEIQLLGIGALLISHSNYRRFKWKGEEVVRAEPDFSPAQVDNIMGACDAVGYLSSESEVKKVFKPDGSVEFTEHEDRRVQYWQPQFTRLAKHRLKGFPETLELPIDRGYETYLKAFEETIKKNQT